MLHQPPEGGTTNVGTNPLKAELRTEDESMFDYREWTPEHWKADVVAFATFHRPPIGSFKTRPWPVKILRVGFNSPSTGLSRRRAPTEFACFAVQKKHRQQLLPVF